MASLPAEWHRTGDLSPLGCAWSEVTDFHLPEGRLHLWIDLEGSAEPAPPAMIADWLDRPEIDRVALRVAHPEDDRVDSWMERLAMCGRLVSAPIPLDEGAVLLSDPPDDAVARDAARLAAQNRAIWATWRAERLDAALVDARAKIAELEAEREELRRQGWARERVFRDLEQRYRNLIESERWRLANELAEALRHPGRRTLRLPWELSRGVWRVLRPRLRRGLRRLVYRWTRPGPARTEAPPLLRRDWDPAWIELGRAVQAEERPPADTARGGVYLLQRTGSAEPLTPNDWAHRLRATKGAAVLVRVSDAFDETAWRGALAGLGDPCADGLIRLLAGCRRHRIPVLFSVCDDACGLGLSAELALQCTHLNGGARAVRRLVQARPGLQRRVLDGDASSAAYWAGILGWR